MNSKLEEIDFIWISCDKIGQVGAFITAGSGFVPDPILKECDKIINHIEECIFSLPVISEFKLLSNVPRPDDFIEMAKRGIFVYDWTDIGRVENQYINSYEKVAFPINPLRFEDLSDQLRSIVSLFKFEEIDFLEKNLISS